MVSPKDLYVAMFEVLRRSSEPGAISQADKVNFQRQRSANTNWLDWAADAKRYLDDLGFAERRSMEAVYWERVAIPSDKAWAIHYADVGLEKWYKSLPDELKATGGKIARRLI